MLDSSSVPSILIGIAALCFPYGYLAMNLMRRSTGIVIPFFILFPLYLAVGISIMVLISTVIPPLPVSQYVLIIGTIPGYFLIVLNSKRMIRSKIEEHHILNFSVFKQSMADSIGKRIKSSANIFSLFIIIFIFAFFGKLTADYSWPPVGDAILDSSLTALTVDRAHVINEIPFSEFPLAYPIGYHSLSANLSFLFNIYPAEAVFIFASFLLSLIGCLLFSLTFILTRSLWLSLPAASTIFIIPTSIEHSNWVGGFFFGGPYPTIFGFMIIIYLILQLQGSRLAKFPSSSRIFPLTAIMLLSLFVTNPNFLMLGIIVVVVYYVIPSLNKSMFLSKRSKNILFVFIEYIKHGFRLVTIKEPRAKATISPTSSSIEHGYYSSPKDMPAVSPYRWGRDNLKPVLLSLLIFLIFIIPFILFDEYNYYERIGPAFNSAYFENTAVGSDIFQSFANAWLALSSDIYLASLLGVQFGLAVVMMVLYSRLIPLFLTCLIFYTILFISSISLISPWILVSLLGSLSFTLIAYSIRLILEKKSWLKSRISIAVIAAFVLVSMLCQISYMINQTYATDSNLLQPNLDEFYTVGQWLDANVSQADRLLNDRSFAGFYLDGFSSMNLSHTYLSDFLLTESPSNIGDYATESRMVEELNAVVWNNPNEPELVYPLLKYYNISYVVLVPDSGLTDLALNTSERYVKKPYSNKEYARYFDSYDFLKSNLTLAGDSSRIYNVR